MTRAILIVSMGTKHLETLENTTFRLECRVREEYPDYRIYHAFANERILNIMNSLGQGSYFSITETLEQMVADGVEEVLIQPAFLIHGIEHERMTEKIRPYEARFQKLYIGKPLLSETDDYKKTIHAVVSAVELEDDEALILIGRGTEHHSNSAYPALEYMAHMLGYTRVFVGTVGGFPSFQNVLVKLELSGYQKVRLMPFLFVVGMNVKKSISGETDSWKSELMKRGYEVNAMEQGLLEIPAIQTLFLEHLEDYF